MRNPPKDKPEKKNCVNQIKPKASCSKKFPDFFSETVRVVRTDKNHFKNFPSSVCGQGGPPPKKKNMS